MYQDALKSIGRVARSKAEMAKNGFTAYLVHSGLAGVYVGLAIALILAIGAPLASAGSPFTKVVMAASFGIALGLVVFAGSDLFTGNTMVMAVGRLMGDVTAKDVAFVWTGSFLGNFAGSVLLGWLLAHSGIFEGDAARSFLIDSATHKMNLGFGRAVILGILCNLLVCLAVWSTYRMTSETGKFAMISWCLMAFVGAGYEHSVANMTLLSAANFVPHGPEVSWTGLVRNLVPVTLGNTIAGVLLVGGAYWYVYARHAGKQGSSGTRTELEPFDREKLIG